MTRFEPVGDVARWKVVYGLLQAADVDGVVTYEEMGTALGLDPDSDRHTLQMATRRAAQELETVDKHAVSSVRNVGYRVVRPDEHVVLAQGQQQRSSRALKRGHSKVVNVDLSGMTPEVRQLTEATMRAFAMQMDFNKRFDARQKRLEDVVATMGARTEATSEELEELKQRLARLENVS